jgi:hypothetical protein
MEKDEKIGFHKGALDTLLKERAEFVRLLAIVEELIKAHAAALKELGVDITKQAKKAEKEEDPDSLQDVL